MEICGSSKKWRGVRRAGVTRVKLLSQFGHMEDWLVKRIIYDVKGEIEKKALNGQCK